MVADVSREAMLMTATAQEPIAPQPLRGSIRDRMGRSR
jgi:hypothetical protein